MKPRSLVAVILLTLFTFGIYQLVWLVKTKNEMNSVGANVPSAWLVIFPIVQYYWFWKWSEGAQHATQGRMSQVGAFVLVLFVPLIGAAIVQDSFNRTAAPAMVPRAYVA